MKILGIDFGQKSIGLAISQGYLAEPWQTIKKGKNLEKIIADLCRKEEIGLIIVGISEGKMAEIQKKFGQNLAKISQLPVEFWDETLTSKEATQKMAEAKVRKKKRKEKEHAFSAALILQSFLDAQNENH